MEIVIGYILVMNVAAFFLMRADKKRAVRHAYRISERTLFLSSLLGGSIGSWAGMYVFRHKTRHWYFVVGMPLILLLHVAIVLFCLLI